MWGVIGCAVLELTVGCIMYIITSEGEREGGWEGVRREKERGREEENGREWKR